jgi:hypothetical protein
MSPPEKLNEEHRAMDANLEQMSGTALSLCLRIVIMEKCEVGASVPIRCEFPV